MVAVKPYTIPLADKWNLVSFPGTPERPGLESVFPLGSGVDAVLAYRQGGWETAVQHEDGRWFGKLSSIEAGYGYWVHARGRTAIETSPLVPCHSTSLSGVVGLMPGWNLVGVVDTELQPYGESPLKRSLDAYLEDVQWRVAFRYHNGPSAAGWVKAFPGDDSMACNGHAYWLWISETAANLPSAPPSMFTG